VKGGSSNAPTSANLQVRKQSAWSFPNWNTLKFFLTWKFMDFGAAQER